MRMEETNSSPEVQEKAEESAPGEKGEDVAKKALVKLSALPTPPASPCAAPLRRSLSYPPSSSHTCRVWAGLCVYPNCIKNLDDEEGGDAEGARKERGSKRRRQSGGSVCRRHKLASMRDSLQGSLESLQDGEFMLFNMEPSVSAAGPSTVLFPRGEQEFAECQVCLVETFGRPRLCCQMHVCDTCLQWYIREKVRHRVLNVRCPNPACCDAICREEIQHHLSKEMLQNFLQYLIEENGDPDQKTCPRCNHMANIHRDVMISKNKGHPDDQKVACLCGLLWCFRCHAPWHEDISCKQYQKGDRLLREWAKEQHYGQPNATKCPKCKVFIQRSSGCDNMTCKQCNTSFCYRCGKRFHHLKFFGSHYSTFSVFGCKYRLLPTKPVQRKLIRGAVFGCKVVAAPVCITAAVGVGCILLVGFGPVYATYVACREYKNRRYLRRRQFQFRVNQEYLEDISHYRCIGFDRSNQDLKPREPTLIDLPQPQECTTESDV